MNHNFFFYLKCPKLNITWGAHTPHVTETVVVQRDRMNLVLTNTLVACDICETVHNITY